MFIINSWAWKNINISNQGVKHLAMNVSKMINLNKLDLNLEL